MWCQLRARRRDEPSPAEGTASRCCSPARVSVLRYEPSVLDCRKAAPGHVGAADSPLCPRGPDILVLFRFEKRNVIFPFGSSSRNGKKGTHSHPPTAWCQVFVPPSRDLARCCASMQPAHVPAPHGAGLMKSSQAFFFFFFPRCISNLRLVSFMHIRMHACSCL